MGEKAAVAIHSDSNIMIFLKNYSRCFRKVFSSFGSKTKTQKRRPQLAAFYSIEMKNELA